MNYKYNKLLDRVDSGPKQDKRSSAEIDAVTDTSYIITHNDV